MLKPKKKLVRREIEKDEVIDTLNRARSFYDVNKKYISYAALVVVGLAILGYLYFMQRSKNNDLAAAQIGKVYSIYDAAATDPRQYKTAIDGAPERGIMGLKGIVDQYGSTDNGQIARFYLANAYYNTGQIDEALKQFESFSGSNKVLAASASAGIAACYESKGKYSDAASAFEKAAGIASNDAVSPDYLASAGRNYVKANEKEKARSAFERIKKDYPKSQAAADVERYLAEISA